MVVVLVPIEGGVNVTTKKVFPPGATIAAGAVVTEKSPGFAPENVIAPKFKFATPVL